MGATYVKTEIKNLAGSGKAFAAEFLVDSGAVDCMAPAYSLQAAGIQPEGKASYKWADGSKVEMEYGFARVSFAGSETVVQVIFGPDGSEPLLGVVALENTGMMIDPRSRTLRRLQSRPLK